MKAKIIEPSDSDKIRVKCPFCKKTLLLLADGDEINEHCKHVLLKYSQDEKLECFGLFKAEYLMKGIEESYDRAKGSKVTVNDENLYDMLCDLDIHKHLKVRGLDKLICLSAGGDYMASDNVFWGLRAMKKAIGGGKAKRLEDKESEGGKNGQ